MIEIGIANAKHQLALNMLAEGLKLPFIAKITGLTVEEIQHLTQFTAIKSHQNKR